MAQHMAGKKIAITGPRKAAEMSKLVEKMGGTPVLRPAQGTVFLDDQELRSSLKSWVEQPPDWTILTTGIGLEAILDMSAEMGIGAQLESLLSRGSVAARGYKTVNALKKRGIIPDVRDDDGSSAGLIRSFAPYDMRGKDVILQLHGDAAPLLVSWLQEQGAAVRQVLPYRHVPPEEQDLAALLNDILEGQIDAVTFTSAPQIRFLAEYAASQGKKEAMLAALENQIIAAAVGKVTANGMLEEGIKRIVVPGEERMGSMMVELGRYFAGTEAVNGYGLA
ncbi:uroporphyrinogen-III synthase [Paenibacillus sp. JX-17]|uniref:Uroporphyrinogen-III synthase n=1 Tax=Paenibacillus lacisoli TaxID=3064525 RepID=A0ABT9CER3_9BACL|nr:uroporphyrinogen-III synthase [Paenibacillus sp. JX-17]MDO7906447.1 uroporphyrinogen-III synthase [Paenibacillus sp. JX-17]